ncbi:MAG TPA: hypothetical protein VGO84_13170 [Burkholderiales bacterium]|nr:hypothetical protein [Burkholderiales bacterium]
MSLACPSADAQQEAGAAKKLPPVTVTASPTRGAVEKSYRKMIAGMDLFERLHDMAPAASLRFKLLPRKRDTAMEHINLEILGDTTAIPVRVAADHTFTLERDRAALAENAAVTPNRRAQSMTWRVDIRTPGLPPDTRRLGDLRLECLIGHEAGLLSNGRPLIGQIARVVTAMVDYCNLDDTEYLFFADRPLFNVVMANGTRRETIPVDRLYAGATADPNWKADLPYCDCEVLVDRTYFLPLGDKSWPDDTLIRFEYMDDDVRPPA